MSTSMFESVISASCHHLYHLKIHQLKCVYSEADSVKAKLTNQLLASTSRKKSGTSINSLYWLTLDEHLVPDFKCFVFMGSFNIHNSKR